MEGNSRYPSIPQKINAQSFLLQRHFRDSRAFSHGITSNLQGAFSVTPPMSITIGAPAEKRNSSPLQFLMILQSSLLFTLLAPIQRVQLLLQNQKAIINSGRLSHPYSGILNCFSRTIRNEGFFSLWRSNGAHIMAFSFQKIVNSGPRPSYSAAFKEQKEPMARTLIAAKFAFAVSAPSLLVHPLLYAETRLANDVISNTGERQFNGVIDVWRKTCMTDGVRGLYRGWGISMIAMVTRAITVNMFVLPSIKQGSVSYQSNILPVENLQIYANGLLVTMAVYPMGTVSRRMMMSSGEGETAKYKNTRDAFSQILKKEGVKSFYKGLGAEFLRLTVSYCLVTAMLRSVTGMVATKRKEIGNDGGGNPASELTWSNASAGTGRHGSGK